jgi:hypothetical protein
MFMIKAEHEAVRSHDFACTMSQKEAVVRALVAEQSEFVGKIAFSEDELATNELGFWGRVVGVTTMSDFRDIELLKLFSSRVAAVMQYERRLRFDQGSVDAEDLWKYLETVAKHDQGKPPKHAKWAED